jgi:hypothetical protein
MTIEEKGAPKPIEQPRELVFDGAVIRPMNLL